MNNEKIPELTFVYNADSTLKAAAGDFITRIVAPSKYPCNLCMVTYGALSMKSPWQKFLNTLPNEKIFLHRDEFHKKYPQYKDIVLPVILTGPSHDLKVFIDAEEIDGIKNTEELKKLLAERLESNQK